MFSFKLETKASFKPMANFYGRQGESATPWGAPAHAEIKGRGARTRHWDESEEEEEKREDFWSGSPGERGRERSTSGPRSNGLMQNRQMTLKGLDFGSDQDCQENTGQRCNLNDSSFKSSPRRRERSVGSARSMRHSPCPSSNSDCQRPQRYRIYSKKRESDELSSVASLERRCDEPVKDDEVY